MSSPKDITVSLDYYCSPKVRLMACFSAPANITDSRLQDCTNEALCYSTINSAIYLFPVFEELANKYNLTFSVRCNKSFSGQFYFYKILLWATNQFIKTKGIDEYKTRMQVNYDGF